MIKTAAELITEAQTQIDCLDAASTRALYEETGNAVIIDVREANSAALRELEAAGHFTLPAARTCPGRGSPRRLSAPVPLPVAVPSQAGEVQGLALVWVTTSEQMRDAGISYLTAEAAQRPNMRFVPIKSVEQQDVQNFHRQREQIKKERTALANQIRGLLAEYGVVINQGVAAVGKSLPEILEDAENGLTARSRELFAELLEELWALDQRFEHGGQRLTSLSQENAVCRLLDGILGIGPSTTRATYAAAGDGKDCVNGRHYSAWLGLVPGQHSTGGKTVLLGISLLWTGKKSSGSAG